MIRSLIAVLILTLVIAGSAAATNYKAQILSSAGLDYSWATAISGNILVGTGGSGPANGTHDRALLWNGINADPVDLTPAGYGTSLAYGTSGSSEVGVADFHAMLWNGTAASAIDLTPDAYSGGTYALGISGNSQVGVGYLPVGNDPLHPFTAHALRWSGSAASVIDLNPSGMSSVAKAVDAGHQVGEGYSPPTGDNSHALLWAGTAASVIDLHPAGFEYSSALGVSGNKQVGYAGNPDPTASGYFPQHAMLWSGTAASAVDLNPAGFNASVANAISGGKQVGFGLYSASLIGHAMVWDGTAASAVDLHQYLGGLGVDFDYSSASGISADGTIVGHADGPTSEGYSYFAVVWTPIPDPVPGDYNQSGIVDAADYTVWRDHLGSSTALANDDTPGVGPDDYIRWKNHFGEHVGSGASTDLSAAPEPASLMIFVTGALAICYRGRSKVS